MLNLLKDSLSGATKQFLNKISYTVGLIEKYKTKADIDEVIKCVLCGIRYSGQINMKCIWSQNIRENE